MFIHNIRYGFATNSSSTHSVIIANKQFRDKYITDQCFGWDHFICASEKSKRQYLGQSLRHCLARVTNLDPDDLSMIASHWAGTEISKDGYIDHQSTITIPTKFAWDKYTLRKDFFQDLLKFFLNPDVVILGGNDNTEKTHPALRKGAKNILKKNKWHDEELGNPVLHLLLESNPQNIRARYDSLGKFWSLFDTNSGTRIRTSFTPESNADKSEVPELVDIKITNFCKNNCFYCYQGSSKSGTHASKELIRYVSYALNELETFEVALGGGEPTEHPDLIDIINDFHYMGIVVNLTTRNVDWIINNLPIIQDKIGGIGLSIDSCYNLVNNLSKLKVAIPTLNWESGIKLTVQVVVGSCSEYELKNILDICKTFNIVVLLLGWKNTHRGANATKEEVNLVSLLNSFWGQKIKSRRLWNGPSISFDTTIVEQMKEWLEAHGDAWTFTTREGAHSMYIDCVNKTMHKSSYDETPGTDLYDNTLSMAENIKKYFSTL
jgi:hypothetical protein